MATLTEQLDEARTAYHDLVTGRAARVVVDANGERVEFAATNSQKLYLYIQSLEAQLGVSNPTITRGPLGFMF